MCNFCFAIGHSLQVLIEGIISFLHTACIVQVKATSSDIQENIILTILLMLAQWGTQIIHDREGGPTNFFGLIIYMLACLSVH